MKSFIENHEIFPLLQYSPVECILQFVKGQYSILVLIQYIKKLMYLLLCALRYLITWLASHPPCIHPLQRPHTFSEAIFSTLTYRT